MASKTIDHLSMTVGVTPYEHEGNKYDALRISVMYSKGYGFYVSWMPVKLTQFGYQTGCLSSQDPLEGGGKAIVERVTKNNSKRLTEMHAALQLAQEGIALYFDKRLFVQMEDFMRYVCLYGFTEHYRQQVENLKAAAEVAPMMRQYNDLKKKHPDALLLFRCGDFYETYQDDAKECAKILGITLTYRCGDKLPMAGFPHHALDTYLPKLVKAGKRVAICDQLEDPKKVAKITNNNNNNETLEDKAMTNNETKNESANVAMQPQVSNHITTEADVEEVNDIVPQVTPKKTEDTKPRFDLEKDKGYRVVLVPAKDGSGEWPKLYGFQTEEEAEKIVGKMAKSIRNTWDRDEKNEKRFYIKGGKKYCEVFQRLCDALNSGDKAAIDAACKDSVAVYEGAVADGKAEREERKAKREAEKTDKNKPSAEKSYTLDEVAQMLGKLLPDGAASTEDIKKLLKAA